MAVGKTTGAVGSGRRPVAWTALATESYGLNLPVGPGQDDVPAVVEHLAARLRRTGVAADDVVDICYVPGDTTDDGVDLPGFSVTLRSGSGPALPGDRTPCATATPRARPVEAGSDAGFGGFPARSVHFRLPEGPGQDSVPDLLDGLAGTLREWEVGSADLLALTHVHGCDEDGNLRPGFMVTFHEHGGEST
jgi:hypothetical protein